MLKSLSIMELKKRIETNGEFDVMNDENYPGSELTDEQLEDKFVNSYLSVINGTAKLYTREEIRKDGEKQLKELLQQQNV
jgi:hypothetical protein